MARQKHLRKLSAYLPQEKKQGDGAASVLAMLRRFKKRQDEKRGGT
ncbi:hypothetical protein GCM10007897_32050 [Sphingobium jiangsuense]|nr:hypothetical protein GCM10007897_32050 [Sphingobium jiangsuense]